MAIGTYRVDHVGSGWQTFLENNAVLGSVAKIIGGHRAEERQRLLYNRAAIASRAFEKKPLCPMAQRGISFTSAKQLV